MANSDTTYGVFNKQSTEIKIYQQPENTVHTQNFGGNVETAKNYFFTADALNCFNTNATQLAWAITDDGNGIKFTIAFGTKKDASATTWADAWKDTKQALIDAGNWFKSSSADPAKGRIFTAVSSDSHLF